MADVPDDIPLTDATKRLCELSGAAQEGAGKECAFASGRFARGPRELNRLLERQLSSQSGFRRSFKMEGSTFRP